MLHRVRPCGSLHIILQLFACMLWRALMWLHLTMEQAQIAFTLDREDVMQGTCRHKTTDRAAAIVYEETALPP